ncbi:MAG: DUF411 domain-containing protein [Gemmatimonadaceae bacterium]
MTLTRRHFVALSVGAAGGLVLVTRVLGAPRASQGALPPMTVYKSAACGCCTSWVDHARASGFTVRTVDTEDLASVKQELGVPPALASCHTVVVGAYVVEGHVPADDVKRLLAEKPSVRGIAVPGMPIGSPGMEQGPRSGYQRYDVLAFTRAGATTVFARH